VTRAPLAARSAAAAVTRAPLAARSAAAVTRAPLAALPAAAAVTRAPLAALSAAALAACGGAPDPCAGAAGTCLAVTVSAGDLLDGDTIDQLEFDILYGGFHDTATTQPGGAARLPVTTALRLGIATTGPEIAVVVVAAKLSGRVLGTGAASPELVPGGHAAVDIELAPPEACQAGSFYCGGDRLAGDPGVLYLCNSGGVPLARGRCELECIVNQGNDDACRGVGGPCTEGGYYCGGDKLDGDPQSLYQCIGGDGQNRRDCPNGCEVRPGLDDRCR